MIKSLFIWNAWANARYRQVFADIGIEKLKVETPYGILLDRIVHIFASFEMWYKRMNGQSPTEVLKSENFSSWSELENKWIEFDQLLINYVNNLTEDKLKSSVTYTSLDGSVYKRKIEHILLHLTAHPNYHRGQISSIFKMMNFPSLPSTDMVIYFLEHNFDK